jgi:hypothetical protein
MRGQQLRRRLSQMMASAPVQSAAHFDTQRGKMTGTPPANLTPPAEPIFNSV